MFVPGDLGRKELITLVVEPHEFIAVVGIVALPEAGELVLRQEATQHEELVAASGRVVVSLLPHVGFQFLPEGCCHGRWVLLLQLREVVA